ncbi:hypothetical protein Tco_1029946 [Tanacetum coccineum]|uniref:Uncharacterized protein n=1 Tax=Tanacetum coccineum TaxID=301880 RepID=A0ABQ5G564_9ASTR
MEKQFMSISSGPKPMYNDAREIQLGLIPNQQPTFYQQTTFNPTTTTTPPIITKASAIIPEIPEIPEITPFIALQLRVTKLEQDMSEVKKFDHSADVLASIQSQVPPIVDKYLGTKLADDASLRS